MKSINIKGKEYIEVNERIKHFRKIYQGYRLVSEIIQLDDKICVILARILDPAGSVIATGLAREVNGSTYINKTSFVENCETSAWGRALGNFGIGIDVAVASAEEVQNAIANQKGKKQAAPPKETSKGIMEQAFFDFTTEFKNKLGEGMIYDAGKFKNAVIKHFKKLPTTKASIKLILKEIKPEDVMTELKSE